MHNHPSGTNEKKTQQCVRQGYPLLCSIGRIGRHQNKHWLTCSGRALEPGRTSPLLLVYRRFFYGCTLRQRSALATVMKCCSLLWRANPDQIWQASRGSSYAHTHRKKKRWAETLTVFPSYTILLCTCKSVDSKAATPNPNDSLT